MFRSDAKSPFEGLFGPLHPTSAHPRGLEARSTDSLRPSPESRTFRDYQDAIQLWSCPRAELSPEPFRNRSVRHVVSARDGADVQDLRMAMDQLDQNSTLTLERLLPGDLRVDNFSVGRAAEKSVAMARLERFLTHSKVLSRTRQSLHAAFDELLTNALFNAPSIAGERPFAARPRTEDVQSPKPITVRLAQNSDQIALSVRDHFGSLHPEDVVDTLYRSCRGVTRSDPHESPSGLFLLLNAADRLVFNIVPEDFTEVILIRDKQKRGREFARATPSLHLCLPESGARADVRQHRRHRVSWSASCRADEAWFSGTVLDVSTQGAFISLASDHALARDQALQISIVGNLVPFSEPLARGEDHDPKSDRSQPLIWCFESEQFPMSLEAKVCWVGENRRYACHGVGLLFDQAIQDLGLE